jgi:hypothetical protein
MIFPREQIYSAIFATLQASLITPAGPFKTVSRRWQDPSQLAPADRPAIYQVQKDEVASTSVNGLPINWKLGLDLVIYTTGDTAPVSIPSVELNSLLDSVESAIRSVLAGLPQTLSGKVSHCRLAGKIEVVENVQGGMALAVVPVEVATSA